VFPGLIIIWLAGLGYGILSGFGAVGWVVFGIMTILMLLGNTLDGVLMAKKALDYGAAKISLVLAGTASIVISLMFSPIAGLITAPLVLFLSEKKQGHTSDEAKEITIGLVTGWGWAFALRFFVGVLMIALWLIWAMR
ncbi:MAG TPA: DUF456 domain-containing protein, partial [Anaerolineales bacterium]|nr:DUF456 domain-containing protein [Anaerolineales bacterium]